MKKILFALFFFSSLCTGFGQKLSASLSKNPVAVGEPFQITFSLDASGSGFQGPDMSNFDVLSGPNGAQSMQIINGNMSQSVSYSYYLSAKKEGHFTLGPAFINCGGKKIESNTVTVDVGKAAAGSKNQQAGTSGKSTRNGDENIFVKTIVSKSSVYQGEQVLITYKVYAHLNLVNFKDAKIPSYTGFWSQDVPITQNYTVTKENLNGVQYMVVEFRKTYLFPQRSGTLEIDPIEIECIVRQQSSRQQDPWSFWGPAQEDVLYKVKGTGTKIEVKPLPESGKPAGFSGAVGQFSLKAKINKDKVKTNDAVNLNVSITGKGNISLVDPPRVQTPPDIESYDPKPSESINVTAGGVEGTKSIEQVLIPRYAGSFN
ncbi:MAG TPA: BatD family protein, partial [Bacteroidia bacterium]|nr:BatD family protein [Bacteroidia bacterium]